MARNCIGAGILFFAAPYWISDVKGHTSWVFFVRSAGSNTLFACLLPDFFEFLPAATGLTYLATHWTFGWPGIIKSVLFPVAMRPYPQHSPAANFVSSFRPFVCEPRTIPTAATGQSEDRSLPSR